MTDTNEKIILLLLKPPSLWIIQELRRRVDIDPNYLKAKLDTVSTVILHHLSNNGVYWDEETFQREGQQVITHALIRLRGIEK